MNYHGVYCKHTIENDTLKIIAQENNSEYEVAEGTIVETVKSPEFMFMTEKEQNSENFISYYLENRVDTTSLNGLRYKFKQYIKEQEEFILKSLMEVTSNLKDLKQLKRLCDDYCEEKQKLQK